MAKLDKNAFLSKHDHRRKLLLDWVNGQDFGGLNHWPIESFSSLSEGRLLTRLLGCNANEPLSRALSWIWQSPDIPMELKLLTPWEVSQNILAGDEHIIQQVISLLYDLDPKKTPAWNARGIDSATKPIPVKQHTTTTKPRNKKQTPESFDTRKVHVMNWLRAIPGMSDPSNELSAYEVENQVMDWIFSD